MKDKVMEELKKAFRPEFLNRIDEITVFHSLQKEHIQEIVKLMAETLTKRLGEQGIDFSLTESALEKIAEVGYDPEYGARPLRRALQREVEDRLSEAMLSGSITKGSKVALDVQDGEFVVRNEGVVQ